MEKMLGPEGGVGCQKPTDWPTARKMSERDLSNVLKMLSLGAAGVNVQVEETNIHFLFLILAVHENFILDRTLELQSLRSWMDAHNKSRKMQDRS